MSYDESEFKKPRPFSHWIGAELQEAPDNGARLAAEEIANNIAYFEDKAAQESIVDDIESIIKKYVG